MTQNSIGLYLLVNVSTLIYTAYVTRKGVKPTVLNPSGSVTETKPSPNHNTNPNPNPNPIRRVRVRIRVSEPSE